MWQSLTSRRVLSNREADVNIALPAELDQCYDRVYNECLKKTKQFLPTRAIGEVLMGVALDLSIDNKLLCHNLCFMSAYRLWGITFSFLVFTD
jgi:hypothetical protein